MSGNNSGTIASTITSAANPHHDHYDGEKHNYDDDSDHIDIDDICIPPPLLLLLLRRRHRRLSAADVTPTKPTRHRTEPSCSPCVSRMREPRAGRTRGKPSRQGNGQRNFLVASDGV